MAYKNMNTKLRILSFVIVLALFLTCGVAFAADSLKVTVAVTPDSFSQPSEAKVSVKVSNDSKDTMEGIMLYDHKGEQVLVFGEGGVATLKPGDAKTVESTFLITQAMLDDGGITYTAKNATMESKGTAKITQMHEGAFLKVDRVVTPQVVRTSDVVTATYTFQNTGSVELQNIKVIETITTKAQSIASLDVGESKTLTFERTMPSADLTSSAKITYKVPGENTLQAIDVDALLVPVAVKGLNVTLSSLTPSVNIGEKATLVLTFENKGNITYSNVTAKDATHGEIFKNVTILPNVTSTAEATVTLTEPTTFKLTLDLHDNTGTDNTLTTNEHSMGVFDPEKTLNLSVMAESETKFIEVSPTNVRMNVTVTNNSNIECKDVEISHGNTFITSIPTLVAGQSVSIVRDFAISQHGKFRFTATSKDPMGNEVSFTSNTLEIPYHVPTPTPLITPTPTVVPLVTLPPASYDSIDPSLRSTPAILYNITLVLLIAFLAVFILFISGVIVRKVKANRSANMYDSLKTSTKRNFYDSESEAKNKQNDDDDDDDDDGEDDEAEPTDEPTDEQFFEEYHPQETVGQEETVEENPFSTLQPKATANRKETQPPHQPKQTFYNFSKQIHTAQSHGGENTDTQVEDVRQDEQANPLADEPVQKRRRTTTAHAQPMNDDAQKEPSYYVRNPFSADSYDVDMPDDYSPFSFTSEDEDGYTIERPSSPSPDTEYSKGHSSQEKTPAPTARKGFTYSVTDDEEEQ